MYVIIKSSKRAKEIKKMAKTSGWYTFADGTQKWFHGLSAREKKMLVLQHGAIVRFIPT